MLRVQSAGEAFPARLAWVDIYFELHEDVHTLLRALLFEASGAWEVLECTSDAGES